MAAPSEARDDVELAVDATVPDEVASDLPHGHAVPDGEGERADEGLETGLDDVPLDRRAGDRVGAVEHDDPGAGAACHPHHEAQGRLVGVVPGADILDVEEHDVQILEQPRGRVQGGLVVAVQRDHRQTGDRIAHLVDVLHVLGRGPYAVLGPEEPDDPDAGCEQTVDRVVEVPVHRGVVAAQPHALAGEVVHPRRQQPLASAPHSHSSPTALARRRPTSSHPGIRTPSTSTTGAMLRVTLAT